MRKSIIIGLALSLLSISAYAGGIVMMGGGVAATASSDYAAAKCYLRIQSNGGATHFGIAIYNSSGTRIGVTDATAVGSTFPAWVEAAITSPPTLTAGQTYYVSVVTSGNYLEISSANTNSWASKYNTRGTWFDVPTTIDPTPDTGDAGLNTGSPAIYCTNSDGQTLLGSTDVTASNVSFQASTNNIYSAEGNSCATLP